MNSFAGCLEIFTKMCDEGCHCFPFHNYLGVKVLRPLIIIHQFPQAVWVVFDTIHNSGIQIWVPLMVEHTMPVQS